ncbi:hypothetical protein XENTR_v10000415 [Xenopus tropicalis]|nr:hypothetical protein XENTR_v10000415 [Xenopus tropicalis]
MPYMHRFTKLCGVQGHPSKNSAYEFSHKMLRLMQFLHPVCVLCAIRPPNSKETLENHIFSESTHSDKTKMGKYIFLLQTTKLQSYAKQNGFYDISENCHKACILPHYLPPHFVPYQHKTF